MTLFLIALTLFFFLELLYFKIADHFNIIDKPNLRSSHTALTIRGGGIIFPVAFIAGILIFEPALWYLAAGVFAIALISFLDDIMTLSSSIRMGVHLIAVGLIVFQVYQQLPSDYSFQIFSLYALFLIPVVFIFVIGIINAYNFMDGINGITVLYSLIVLGSMLYVQENMGIFLLNKQVFILVIAALVIFGVFNVRKKAKAFAGDVGSISMSLILCFLLLQLIWQTQDLKWVFFLGIYGLDAVATIFCRIIRKENIFEAHRSHLYQYLANEKKYGHILVAAIYAGIQMVLNLVIIYAGFLEAGILFSLIVFAYVIYRLKHEGYKRLFEGY